MYRKNKRCPISGYDFWRIITAWTILVEGHHETFLPNYIEIGPLVSDKQILKVSK